MKDPFRINNVRRFIVFRVCFNARFYYPVFTVMFLDFGLTLEQFAVLNAVWAMTIVLLEVPSGALADAVGRKKLLVFTAVLMVCEMAVLCFAPVGRSDLLFALFLINRILSGTAEAAASGADEAIAYDALKKEGDPGQWRRVLEQQMRIQSAVFIGAMSLGAAVYDPHLMQRVAAWLGLPVRLEQSITLRFPLFLTLGMALLALRATLRMEEEPGPGQCADQPGCVSSALQAFKVTLRAGGWILHTPFAVVLIAAGLLFDHVVRLVMTLNSQYYRLIQIPEACFGLIGSGLALLGLFIPRIASMLAQHRSPAFKLFVVATTAMTGLLLYPLRLPWLGVLPVVFLFSVMYLNNFLLSDHLNRITDSSIRATVLSFKGLSLNMAYGLVGLLYSGLLAVLRSRIPTGLAESAGENMERLVFARSLVWFPAYFVVLFGLFLLFARRRLRGNRRAPR